jgi:hypothetical protein
MFTIGLSGTVLQEFPELIISSSKILGVGATGMLSLFDSALFSMFCIKTWFKPIYFIL